MSSRLGACRLAAILVTFVYVFKIPHCSGIKCSSNQVDWVKNGVTTACTACIPCQPGFEYTVSCGTKVRDGTYAECRPCPEGKYSHKFDSKPCVACTRCSSGRRVLQNCTSTQNAQCSRDCMSGYYHEPVVFGCHKCTSCCFDGKDETAKGCKVAKMCKERPNGCPLKKITNSSTPAPAKATPKISNYRSPLFTRHTFMNDSRPNKKHIRATPTPSAPLSTTMTWKHVKASVAASSQVELSARNGTMNMTVTIGQKVLTEKAALPTQKPNNQGSESSSVKRQLSTTSPKRQSADNSDLLKTFVIGLLLIIILALGWIIVVAYRKRQGASSKAKSGTLPVVDLPSVSGDSQSMSKIDSTQDLKLVDWCDNHTSDCDSFCQFLNKRKRGLYDFERVARKLKIERQDVAGLKTELHKDGGCPSRTLLEKLCSERPELTLRALGTAVKEVKNEEAYRILKSYITSATTRV